MSLPTYRQMIDAMEPEVIRTWCHGCRGFDATRHQVGVLFDGTLHWSRERTTRAGMKRFGEILFDDLRMTPEWRRIWLRSVSVYHWAIEYFSVQLGRKVFEADRARVRYLLADTDQSAIAGRWEYETEAKRAAEWARE